MDKILASVMSSMGTTSSTTGNTSSANISKEQATALLTKQLMANGDINKLLNTVLETAVCGPECQKQQISDQLKQKLDDAQYNEQTAPLRLEKAKKYYYVYTKGRPYYDRMIEKELEEKGVSITKQIAEKFNEEVQNARAMNSFFNTSQLNSENTIELYNEYVKKNNEMREIIKGSRGDVLTNDRKTYYETEALERIKLWQKFMMYIYWILVVTYCVTIFISPSNLSKKQQIALVVFFILYPFFIHQVVMFFYNYFTTMFIKNTDTNVYLDL
jgi:ABC-type multidrug transport system fused ATPase/permease subunit